MRFTPNKPLGKESRSRPGASTFEETFKEKGSTFPKGFPTSNHMWKVHPNGTGSLKNGTQFIGKSPADAGLVKFSLNIRENK